MEMEVHRDLGKHDAQIEALQARVDGLHADLTRVLRELQQINETLAQARGGWRTLMAVAGLASAVTAVMVKGLSWLTALPGAK